MIARKRFGQHFLEPAWVVKVIDAIAPGASDRFFEIGPGRFAVLVPVVVAWRSAVGDETAIGVRFRGGMGAVLHGLLTRDEAATAVSA